MLSLLRVESLTVELMISKSFGEADHQKNAPELDEELQRTDQKLQDLLQQSLSSYLQPLTKFFDAANLYLKKRMELMVRA